MASHNSMSCQIKIKPCEKNTILFYVSNFAKWPKKFTAYRRSRDALLPGDAHFSLGTLAEERKRNRRISFLILCCSLMHSCLLQIMAQSSLFTEPQTVSILCANPQSLIQSEMLDGSFSMSKCTFTVAQYTGMLLDELIKNLVQGSQPVGNPHQCHWQGWEVKDYMYSGLCGENTNISNCNLTWWCVIR